MPADDVTLEKTLPNNLEAERSILGSILLDDKALHLVVETLRREDFYLESHRHIFGKMLDLAGRSKAIDLITLKDELQRTSDLERAGGAAYIAGLTDGLPRAVNVEHYADIVKEKSTLRRLIQISNEIMARSFQSEDPAERILEDVEKAVFELANQRFRSGFAKIGAVIGDVYKRIEELSNRKSTITGVETGFADLDRMTAGLQPSDLVIIAARPSFGKTALSLNIAQHAAQKRGLSIGIFSLEMSCSQLVKRLLCGEAEVDSHKVNTGFLNKEDWIRLGRAAGALSQTRIFIDDAAGASILEMRSKARRLKSEHGLDLLIVDYLQLMSGSRGSRFENRTQEISQISRGLKGLAKELEVPIIAISQLNRAVEARRGDHRPQLSDLRESGSIEQDADVVIFISREDTGEQHEQNAGVVEIIIGKQRNGPIGSFNLAFIRQFTKFANLHPEA